MILLQAATQLKSGNDFTIVTIIGAIWVFVTFLIGFIDNRLKRKLEYFKTIREYNKDLKEWANQVVDIMTTAGLLCKIDPKKDLGFYTKRHNLLVELSSWADKGRFFLPNTGVDSKGQHKPSAFRGFRSEAIDHVVTCYNHVSDIDYIDKEKNIAIKEKIMNTKRDFVSAIQDELDPRKVELEFIGILKSGL